MMMKTFFKTIIHLIIEQGISFPKKHKINKMVREQFESKCNGKFLMDI